ncbi:RVP-2 domain containing protein, partial [Pyrenophora tritici-repentis]
MVKGKQLVQGQQFVFKCKVATSNSYIDTEALTDSGATGNCISTLFAQRHNLPTFRLKQPLQLRLGDGNFAMAPITHGVLAPISHAEHVSEELFYSVPMTTYDFIFGTSWLEEHNPHIDWREKTMRFNSEHCYANCLHKGEQVTVRSSRHRRAAAKAKERNPTYANMDIHHVSGEAAAALASRPENGTIWLYPHDFEQLDKDDSDDADERAQASRVFASLFAMDMNALSQEDIDKFHQKLNSPAKTRDEVLDKLPEWLHDLAHRFNPDPATTDLPARRGAVDHSIDIIPGSKHPNAKMYGISKDEGLAVKAY